MVLGCVIGAFLVPMTAQVCDFQDRFVPYGSAHA